MFIYTIVVKNVPAERLHYTLRHYDGEYLGGVTHYNVFLGLSGRLTSSKGAAYFPTDCMARAILSHYQSFLEARNYGDISFDIKKIIPNKWDLRRMDRTLVHFQNYPAFKDLLHHRDE